MTNRVIRAAKPATAKDAGFMGRIVDTLSGLISGMGTEKDKLATATFVQNYLSQQEADAAFRSDWMARKIVTIPPYDATREWRAWQGDADDITALEDAERTLGVQRKTMSALIKDRLYGGGALILGVNQGRNEDELIYENIKQGDLKFVHAVSRYDFSAGPMIRDIGSPYFGEPEYYERGNAGETGSDKIATGTRFHPSRVVRFVTIERQDAFSASECWGDSILQSTADAIKTAGLISNSSGQLVAEAKVDIIRIPGLSDNMASAAYEQKMTKRFALANMVKGVYSMLLLDKEEEWERQNATFTGLPDMMQMALLMASGAGDIPSTRFLGQSPAGLTNSGDGDLRNYYDNVGTVQKIEITPKLSRLDNVLIPSALGKHPEELFYMWNPLWQMTPKEKAEVDKSKADVFKIDVDSGVLDSVVLKKARENQLIESGVYPGFETILDEFDGMGEEQPNENEGTDPADPFEPANENERSEDDPNANPDKMAEEGEGNDPASKAAPRKQIKKPSKAIGDAMRPGTFKHMRKRISDATPRTLYVRRDLLNIDDIRKWAKAQGFKSIINDLHVTLIYSKDEVDWIKLGSDSTWGEDDKGNLTVKAGGPRVMEQFGKAQVLVFGSDALTYRHMRFRDMGCSCDYEDYNPHLTISYAGDLNLDQLMKVQPYQGVLTFGPEIFEEIKTGFDNDLDVEELKL